MTSVLINSVQATLQNILFTCLQAVDACFALLSSDWPIFWILTSDIQRLHESGLKQFKCRQRCGWWEASVGSRNQGCNYCLDTRITKAGMCFKDFPISQPHFYVPLLLSVNIFIINFITRHHQELSTQIYFPSSSDLNVDQYILFIISNLLLTF